MNKICYLNYNALQEIHIASQTKIFVPMTIVKQANSCKYKVCGFARHKSRQPTRCLVHKLHYSLVLLVHLMKLKLLLNKLQLSYTLLRLKEG